MSHVNQRPPWCFLCSELSKKASLIKIEAKKFFSIKFLALISRKRRMIAAYNLLQKCLKFCLELNERQNKCLTGNINPFSKSIPVPLNFLINSLTDFKGTCHKSCLLSLFFRLFYERVHDIFEARLSSFSGTKELLFYLSLVR